MSNRVLRILALLSLPVALSAQTLVNGGRQITGTWDAAGAASTRPAKTGSSLPASCAVGEQFFKTDATAGQNLYLCTAANTWTQMSGGGGGSNPPAYTTTPFSPVRHVVDWFGTCGSNSSTIGQLLWVKGGSNFVFNCGTVTSGDVPIGASLTANGSGVYSAWLGGMMSDWVHPGHTKRWTIEYDFTADASMQTGQMLLGLADATVAGTYVAVTHGNGEGFNLCMSSPGAGKCFNAVAGWDTVRHTVRFERVSGDLIRARIDGGPWYNWHSEAGTNGPNDLYSVSFFATALRPQVWANPLEPVAKSFSVQRFEVLYGY